jgi:DNA-binding NarL/FixJ family response regulator
MSTANMPPRGVNAIVRVAVLDDHPALRAGLEAILTAAIVGKSSSTGALLAAIREVAQGPRSPQTISRRQPESRLTRAATAHRRRFRPRARCCALWQAS